MDVYFCFSGERQRKGGERFAKGLNTPIRLDVCDIVFMLGSYTTIEQFFASFSQIGMGFSIGTETPAHPLIKIIL